MAPLTARQRVDRILRQNDHHHARPKRIIEFGERQRQARTEKAKEEFLEKVVDAAKNGWPSVKLLELDSEGGPESYRPGNGRESLRSKAYQDFWDFVVNEGFVPEIHNYSNADGPGYGVGYSSDSDWICCLIKRPKRR